MILSLGALEKVKFREARHLVEMTIARQPNVLESSFRPLDHFEAVHCDEHPVSPVVMFEPPDR
jgi:hypothetical protein